MKWGLIQKCVPLICCAAMLACASREQGTAYTTENAHSHNDYEQKLPFKHAFDAGFGSIEVDVFLREGELFVAHDAEDIRPERTLKALYLQPISELASERSFQLLIDLKTAADSTLPVLVQQLASYPAVTGQAGKSPAVRVVISGNRPEPEQWTKWPSFIFFDGRPDEHYPAAALERVGLISASFLNYSSWDGSGPLSPDEKARVREVVERAHVLGKPFRFWAIPDNPQAWELMKELSVDYINTDRIDALASWLENEMSAR